MYLQTYKIFGEAILQTGNLCEKTTFLPPPLEFRWKAPRLVDGKVRWPEIETKIGEKLIPDHSGFVVDREARRQKLEMLMRVEVDLNQY